ncbi:MAG: hypothetical protein WC641_05010 [Patescibacteria group bacterium]
MDIPRHDESDAAEKLVAGLTKLVDSICPYEHSPDSARMGVAFENPKSNACYLFYSRMGDPAVYNVALHVSVMPLRATNRLRFSENVYEFEFDGTVVVYDEVRTKLEELASWQDGMKHLLQSLAERLKESAAWEMQTTARLESAV